MGVPKMRTEIQAREPGPLLRRRPAEHCGIYRTATGGGSAVSFQIDEAIRSALPDTMQKISWSMPTYWKKRNLIQFAAFQKHIGLYPGPEAVEAFAQQLQGYKTSKGAIQFPYEEPLPLDLIGEIAAWCGKEYGK